MSWKRKYLPLLFLSPLFGATPQQIESYLSLSPTQEELIEIERSFRTLQENLQQQNPSLEHQTYDMQLLTLRFKEAMEKALSQEEMAEVLENYHHILYLRFIALQQTSQYPQESTLAYEKALEDEPQRKALLEKIHQILYAKAYLSTLFDGMMKPLLGINQQSTPQEQEDFTKMREAFIETKQKEHQKETFFMLQEFTLEELEALLLFLQKPSVQKENRAVASSLSFAMEAFFQTLSLRYRKSAHKH
jgi:hypothetical protein